MQSKNTLTCGLDRREWDIVGGLLQMISSFGGRRGCDDFHLERYLPEVEDRRDVMKRFHTYNGAPGEYDPEGDFQFEHAWVLAALYSEQVSEPEYLKNWEFRLIAALLRHGTTSFSWQATPLSDDAATQMRRIADMLWTEDASILRLE